MSPHDYRIPIKGEQLSQCEFIKEMKGAYFEAPQQSETVCEGYRNTHTGVASNVCQSCEWFSDNQRHE